MALQSSSSLSSPTLFSSQLSAQLNPILTSIVSNTVDANRSPIQLASTIESFSAINNTRSRLQAITNEDTALKTRFDSITAAFSSVSTQLTSLASVVTESLTASSGELAGLNAAAAEIVSSIQNTLSGVRAENSDFAFSVTPPTGDIPNTRIIDTIAIRSVDGPLPSSGVSATFQATNTGGRAQFDTGIVLTGGGGATAAGDIDIDITGSRGTASVSIANGTAIADAVTAINAEATNTGVLAEETGVAGQIRLYAELYGSDHTITLTETQDTSNEVSPQNSTGVDATGTLTINGEAATVTASGRLFSFDVGGVSGDFRLYNDINDTNGLAEFIGTIAVSFTIAEGGVSLDDRAGSPTLIGLPELEFNNLGTIYGGLEAIDLENAAEDASRIVTQAQEDLDKSSTVADQLSDALSSRITAQSNALSDLVTAEDDAETVIATLASFDQALAASDLSSALALFSQTQTLFPIAAANLLG